MLRYVALFGVIMVSVFVSADTFLDEDGQSFQKSKDDPSMLVFVTSHVIPITPELVQNTPYGRMIAIPQEALNPQNHTNIVAKGMYNHGNYTIFRSDNNNITFYRHTRNTTRQYTRMAPNIYKVTHFAGSFYKVEPMPPRITACSLIISRTFEAQKTSSPQVLLDLNKVPNQGVADILLECPKPPEY